jgi:hypothetical protein
MMISARRILLCVAVYALLVVGGSCTRPPGVIVEDHVSGAPFEIIRVDEEAVQRVEHGLFVTRVPYPVIPAGVHTLKLRRVRLGQPQLGTELELKISVADGSRYRLEERDGMPSLAKVLLSPCATRLFLV